MAMTHFTKFVAVCVAAWGFSAGMTYADERIDPEQGLDCLETLLSVNPKQLDIKALAKLLEARDIDGLGKNDRADIERIVVFGTWGMEKFDIYDSSLMPRLKFVDAAALEKSCQKRCDNCNGVSSRAKQCGACRGSGRCNVCKGSGHRDEQFNGRYLSCLTCRQSGKCKFCNGRGSVNVEVKCETCGGRGAVYNKRRIWEMLVESMKSLFMSLCKQLDKAEMSEVLKKDYENAKNRGETFFHGVESTIERNEQAERERQRERREREENDGERAAAESALITFLYDLRDRAAREDMLFTWRINEFRTSGNTAVASVGESWSEDGVVIIKKINTYELRKDDGRWYVIRFQH